MWQTLSSAGCFLAHRNGAAFARIAKTRRDDVEIRRYCPDRNEDDKASATTRTHEGDRTGLKVSFLSPTMTARDRGKPARSTRLSLNLK